jgi:hypothetical protein
MLPTSFPQNHVRASPQRPRFGHVLTHRQNFSAKYIFATLPVPLIPFAFKKYMVTPRLLVELYRFQMPVTIVITTREENSYRKLVPRWVVFSDGDGVAVSIYRENIPICDIAIAA